MGEEVEDEGNCSVLVLTPKNRSWRESRACKAVVVLERLPLLLRLVVLVGNKSLLCTRLVVVVVVHARIGGIHIMMMKQLPSNMPTTTPRLLSRRCRR